MASDILEKTQWGRVKVKLPSVQASVSPAVRPRIATVDSRASIEETVVETPSSAQNSASSPAVLLPAKPETDLPHSLHYGKDVAVSFCRVHYRVRVFLLDYLQPRTLALKTAQSL